MKEYLPLFPLEFQNRIHKFRRWQDAQLSFLGRILLMNLLYENNMDLFQHEIKYSKYNRPYLEHNPIYFNISHSGNIVICAISDQCILGIDIEEKKEIKFEDFKFQMTGNEWNKIQNSKNAIDTFYTYWCQKEAVIKTHGYGLSIPLKSFELKNNQTEIEGEPFYVQELFLEDDYKCFLGTRRQIDSESIQLSKCHINTNTIPLYFSNAKSINKC